MSEWRRLPEDPIEDLVQRIDDVKRRLDALEMPTGTQIAETVANLVTPVVGNSSTSGFTLTTSEQTLITFNLAVPDGFSRAAVVVFGSATAGTNSPAERMFLRCRIGGIVGPTSTSITTSLWVSGASSSAASLTALSGVLTVSLSGWLQFAVGDSDGANATLTASATFLR